VRRKPDLVFGAALLAVLGFAWGMVELGRLRFTRGDHYPPYSSLRSDPRGCRILFTALQEQSGMQAQRWLRPLSDAPVDTQTTLWILGVKSLQSLDEAQVLDLVRRGSRVVIALQATAGLGLAQAECCPAEPPPEPASDADSDAASDSESLVGAIGDTLLRGASWLGVNHNTAVSAANATVAQRHADATAFLPAELFWSGKSGLTPDRRRTAAWQILYSYAEQPVVLEHQFAGGGSLVLLADSYLLSNEAMLLNRQPQLLAYLVGHRQQMLFCETQHGLMAQTSIAALLRRYRLHGAVIGLLVVALLFIGRQSSSLLPPQMAETATPQRPLRGHDADAGMTSLLRRHLSEDELLAKCVHQWQLDQCLHGTHISSAQQQQIQAIIAEQHQQLRPRRNWAAAYKRIQAICQEKEKAHGQQ